MQLIDFFKKKFHLWRQGNIKEGRPPLWFSVVVGGLLFMALWTVIALGGLRVFLPHLFSLAGGPFSSRSYLIVFQNNTEIRPTGGFISAYGVLDIKYGFWPQLHISDVYGTIDDHPYVAPPYPMAELLANEWYQGYTFRDANYNPNFPTSAADLLTFYHKTNPDADFDGVLAVDFSLIQNLTAAVGSVSVDDQEFTGENLFEMIEENVSNVDRHNITDLANRKNVLRDFAKALFKEIAFSPLHWRKVSDTIVNGLEEKHILLAFSSSNLRRFTDAHNWSGAMEPQGSTTAQDFLALVESNLGGMKSNRYITRDITYIVDFSAGMQPSATVSVTLSHHGNYNEPLSGEYTGYMRFYVPPGSTSLPSQAHPESVGRLPGWGDVITLKPQESVTLTYEYALPASVLQDDVYSLFLRKQPGTNADRVRVLVRLPQGKTIESNTFTPQESIAYYDGDLDQDLLLSFVVVPDHFGPRVSFQELTGLNRIEIHFNEKIQGDNAADPLNYTIIDLDLTNTSAHDTITITDIEHFDKTVILHTKGMTVQNEEFYKVVLQNIADVSGNFIDSNPREITVVQRF